MCAKWHTARHALCGCREEAALSSWKHCTDVCQSRWYDVRIRCSCSLVLKISASAMPTSHHSAVYIICHSMAFSIASRQCCLWYLVVLPVDWSIYMLLNLGCSCCNKIRYLLKQYGCSVIVIIIVRLAPFQCVAPLAANNLQSGLSGASSVASSTLRLWDDRSFFIVASQEVL